jgi:hypothetical protein
MPSRETIDATVAKMDEFSAAGDMQSWAGFLMATVKSRYAR